MTKKKSWRRRGERERGGRGGRGGGGGKKRKLENKALPLKQD